MISSWNVKVYHQLYEACSASRCCMKHINFPIHSLSSHLCQHPVHVKRHARENGMNEGGDECKVKEEKKKKLHFITLSLKWIIWVCSFIFYVSWYKKWKHSHFFAVFLLFFLAPKLTDDAPLLAVACVRIYFHIFFLILYFIFLFSFTFLLKFKLPNLLFFP